MGTITIIFLLVMYIIGAVSGGTAFGVSHSSQQKQKGKDRDGSLKVIKYYFEDGINQTMKELFLKAAEAWENYTCIKFEEDRSGTKLLSNRKDKPLNMSREFAAWDAIIVEGKEGGDCSYTGKPGEPQWLSVGCGYFSGAAHEIGHALGLFHTHSRYDRNAYVYVNWTNVKFYEKEYGKVLTKETDHHGVPYDYGSIMH
ncbi:astacin [Ancylostoma duodenale]|uniref:Metalloendopeptidase n=1 Tax=Ancylostoma duodenale TaxID=51022 RepID=A0A0C2CCG1_9BILA|nr:astacin [Ancylostoma duodenale]